MTQNQDTCVCCGECVPEGRQVCPACEGGSERVYAVWHDHKVIGYVKMTAALADKLNSTHVGVYYGYDRVTEPERYIRRDKP